METIVNNRFDSLSLDILLIITKYCAKHDYVALYLAYPRLSRRLYTMIPQGLSIRFIRSVKCSSEFKAIYDYELTSPYLSFMNSWHERIYYDPTNSVIVMSIVRPRQVRRVINNQGIKITLPYDKQLYIHLKKSQRSLLADSFDDSFEDHHFANGCCKHQICPDCMAVIERREANTRCLLYGSDSDY